jgi:hypothetical protein
VVGIIRQIFSELKTARNVPVRHCSSGSAVIYLIGSIRGTSPNPMLNMVFKRSATYFRIVKTETFGYKYSLASSIFTFSNSSAV